MLWDFLLKIVSRRSAGSANMASTKWHGRVMGNKFTPNPGFDASSKDGNPVATDSMRFAMGYLCGRKRSDVIRESEEYFRDRPSDLADILMFCGKGSAIGGPASSAYCPDDSSTGAPYLVGKDGAMRIEEGYERELQRIYWKFSDEGLFGLVRTRPTDSLVRKVPPCSNQSKELYDVTVARSRRQTESAEAHAAAIQLLLNKIHTFRLEHGACSDGEPPLSSFRIVLSTEQRHVASTNIHKVLRNAKIEPTVYIHPYFFELSELKQVEILYYCFVGSLTKRITDPQRLLEDAQAFAALYAADSQVGQRDV